MSDQTCTLQLREGFAIQLRPMDVPDLPVVARIYDEAVLHSTATFEEQPRSESQWEAWLKDEHGDQHPAWVVLHNGVIVGWCALSRFDPRSAFRHTAEPAIYLAPSAQHQGLGRALLYFLENQAKERGLHTLICRVCTEIRPSVRLLEHAGYERVGTEKQVAFKFGRWLDVAIYQKVL